MMITRELYTSEEILKILTENWHENDASKLPPMFHGTDESLINISKEERLKLNGACETIIKGLVKLFVDHSINPYWDETLQNCRDDHGNSRTVYGHALARLAGSKLYSYGDFYVSNEPDLAIDYSKIAWIFGETGWMTNRLVEGAAALGFSLPDDDDFKNAFSVFESRKNRAKKPVVIMVSNSDSAALYMKNGMDIHDYELQSIRKIKGEDSYRLELPESERGLTFYSIKEDDYPELLNAWNQLKQQKK